MGELGRDLNPGPLTRKERIIPLNHKPLVDVNIAKAIQLIRITMHSIMNDSIVKFQHIFHGAYKLS